MLIKKNNLINSKNFLFLIYLLTILIYLHFWRYIPIDILTQATFDDGWFMTRAFHILRFEWFGKYDFVTLIKGPAYAFFLALTALSGLSLQFTSGLLHVFSSGLIIYSLLPYIKNSYYSYFIFLILLLTQFVTQRVIRDEFSLCIFLVCISLIVICFVTKIKERRKPINILLLGLMIGIFLLTREDSFYSIIIFIPLFLLIVFFTEKKYIKENFSSIVLIFVVALSLHYLYKTINYFKYGSFVGIELLDSDYQSALESIYRVRDFPAKKYIDVSGDNLESIYKISPSMKKISNYLRDNSWIIDNTFINPESDDKANCLNGEIICKDYHRGYFMWALRKAAHINGIYSSPTNAKNFYRSITNEINQACEDERLKCKNKFLSKIPNYELFEIGGFVKSFFKAIDSSTKLKTLNNGKNEDSVRVGKPFTKDDLYASNLFNISSYIFIKNEFEINIFQDSNSILQALNNEIGDGPDPEIIFAGELVINFYNQFAKSYNLISKIILLFGLLSLLFLIINTFIQKKIKPEFLICILLWAAYFNKVLLLSIVNYFWMPYAINYLYMYPAIVLLPLASLISIYFSFNEVKNNFQKNK